MIYRRPELLLGLALFFLDSGTNIKWPLGLNNSHEPFKFQHPVKAREKAAPFISVMLGASEPWFTPALVCHFSNRKGTSGFFGLPVFFFYK